MAGCEGIVFKPADSFFQRIHSVDQIQGYTEDIGVLGVYRAEEERSDRVVVPTEYISVFRDFAVGQVQPGSQRNTAEPQRGSTAELQSQTVSRLDRAVSYQL